MEESLYGWDYNVPHRSLFVSDLQTGIQQIKSMTNLYNPEALEVFLNGMRYINPRFTYLLITSQ